MINLNGYVVEHDNARRNITTQTMIKIAKMLVFRAFQNAA